METNAGIDRQIEEEEEGRLIDGEIEGGREVRRVEDLCFLRTAPLRSGLRLLHREINPAEGAEKRRSPV